MLLLVLAGVIIVSVGVVGLYVGRIFEQVKNRPLFLIDREALGEPGEHRPVEQLELQPVEALGVRPQAVEAVGGGPQAVVAVGGGPQAVEAVGGGPQAVEAVGGGPQAVEAVGGGPQAVEAVGAGPQPRASST